MKKQLLLALSLLPLAARAQGVGLGTSAPAVSAVLEVRARVSLTSLTDARAVPGPAPYLLVFNTNAAVLGGADFYYNAGAASNSSWVRLNTGAVTSDDLGSHVATQALNLQGSALIGRATDIGAAVGMGVRTDGELNPKQNTAGYALSVGYQAGASSMGSGPTTGSPDLTNTVALSYAATVGASNTSQLGNVAISSLRYQAGLTMTSDARCKYDVRAPRPVSYRLDEVRQQGVYLHQAMAGPQPRRPAPTRLSGYGAGHPGAGL